MNNLLIDPYLRVEVLAQTPNPNLVSYLEMHQCYSEHNVFDQLAKLSHLPEQELGDRLVKKCLSFGHWGILESPSITFNIIGFPHSVLVQARTHRIGVSFSATSQRYTSERFLKLNETLKKINPLEIEKISKEIEKLFYFRPTGFYQDRNGNKYEYTEEMRIIDILDTKTNIEKYYSLIHERGFAPEHARDMLYQNFRQNFVVTFNARSLLHFLDLRTPKDAQLEIQIMAHKLFEKFEKFMPEVAEFYLQKRLGKSKLSP